MKHLFTAIILSLPSAQAATSFLETVDSNFNNAANWDNGLPSAGNNGTVTAPTALTATFNSATGINYDMDINSSMSTGAFEFQHRAGSNGRDVRVGNGATGSLTINNGGRLDIAGAGADLFIGLSGGTGTVSFEDGSTFEIQKTVEVLNGSLEFAPNVAFAGSIQDELVIGNAGTLAIAFDSSFNHFAFGGQSLVVELGATSTLDLTFATAPTSFSTFTLATDVSGFTLVGGTGTGVFGNVNVTGLGAGQSVVVDYGTTTAGELAITIVPEPSPWWLGLAGGGLFFVRRRR